MALRMARRDVHRDSGRSLFVWLMIALPIGIIAALQVVIASNNLSQAEYLELKLGGTQSVLTQTGTAFNAAWDGYGSAIWGDDGGEPRPVPGWGNTIAEHEAAVAVLVGRPVTAITESNPEFGSARSIIATLGVDPAQPMGGRVALTSGRMPGSAAEALVTPSGRAYGLPSSGEVTLYRGEVETRVTIVGTGVAGFESLADLVTLPDATADRLSFFVTSGAPISWVEAENLAGYGFETASRGIVADPPTASEPRLGELGSTFLVWMVSVAAMVEVALVVGPAFAIGAARQRRGLALAAANGAGLAQLRRSALGQALLLGASGTLLGTLLGAGTGVLAWTWIASDRTELHGPLELPAAQLAGTLVLGIATALGAALVTSRGLAKLDLVGTLRGSLRSAPPRRGAPVVGVVLVATGLAGVWLAMIAASQLRFLLWTIAALGVLVGVLLCVPGLLGLAARIAGGTPMAVRMALRDTSRQRGRATSTVAAVLAGGLILSTVWTLVLSTDADSERRYRPWSPAGQGSISLEEPMAPSVRVAINGVDPELRTYLLGTVYGLSAADDVYVVGAIRPGCTNDDLAEARSHCASLSSNAIDYGQTIMVGEVDDLATLFDLDASQRKALNSGHLLVNADPAPDAGAEDPQWAEHHIVHGSLTFACLSSSGDSQTTQVPATPVTRAVIERGASPQVVGALISTRAAGELGWAVGQYELRVVDPRGEITPALEAEVVSALEPWDESASLTVERGYESTPQPLLWGVTATLVLLAVVAAVIATVMSTIELRPFLGTFAAIGAGPGLSRRLAATQALLLGVIGTLLGCVIGSLAGAPLAIWSTGDAETLATFPPLVRLPWLLMGGLMVGIPSVAALVAALCVPARPALVRRAG